MKRSPPGRPVEDPRIRLPGGRFVEFMTTGIEMHAPLVLRIARPTI
jgi:hypothetical protein